MEKVALKTATTNYFDENNEKKRKKPFLYKKTDLGRQILEEAKNNLQITDSKKYKLLLKIEKGVYKYVDLDSPLNSLKIIDNSTLILVKEEEAIKIILNKTFSRTILVDATLPIHDILKPISEKLHYKCQYNQYTIWAYDKSDKLVPLNSNLSIAEQTQNYRSLIFRRRFYLVFAPDFAEFEEAKHIYRDMKQQYLEGLTFAELDQAAQLAYLMMYADFETQEEAQEYVNKISNDREFNFKSLLPQNHGKFHTDKFKKKFISTFKAGAPLEQFAAMDKFIRESRTLKNFGDEFYKCILANQSDGIKCHLYIGPHGIQLMDQSESKELEKIHILKIKSFKQKKRMINIKFKDDKNNDKSVSISLSKVDFITTMLNDSINFIQSYYNSELDKQRKRAIGVSDEIKLAGGQYTTLAEAEQAIELFKAEMFKLDDILYTNYGLQMITDADDVKVDDYTKLNEIASLKEFSSNLNDILLNNMPNVSLQHIIGNSVKKKMTAFLDEVKEMRINSHEIKYKESKFVLNATISYLRAIEVSFPGFKLGPKFEGSYSRLMKLIQSADARYEKRRTQDISDLVSLYVEELNEIIVEFPTIENHVDKVISSFPKLNQADKAELKDLLPKGQLTSIVLLDSILNFIDISYSKKNTMFKAEDVPSYQKVMSDAYDFYPKIFQFAEDLINGSLKDKRDINDRFNNILSIFSSINPFIVEVSKSEKLKDADKNELKTSANKIVRIFDLLKICSIGKGEYIESKLYTGTHSKLTESINILPTIEKTLKSLLDVSYVSSDSSLSGKVNNLIEYVNKNGGQIKSSYQKLEKEPSDTTTRYKTTQILQEINVGIHSIYDSIYQHKPDSDLTNQFTSIFKCVESSLHALSPDNCSLRRVDVCIKSFMSIVEAIDEKHITDSWVEPLKEQLREMKDFYAKLVNSPTDGSILARLHDYMCVLLGYVKNIQENLVLANHRTVPLIIEISIPNILRALVDPLITDEYERCDHLVSFNQMQYDLRQLINFSLTLLRRPNISGQKEIANELLNHVKVLQTIYIEYSSRRNDLFANPYAYALALPILNMVNHIKMTEANMINVIRKIDDINMNYALKKCLCQSMVSATEFVDSANKLKLRPYRQLFTVQEITDYRMNIINLVAFIKNAIIDEKGKNAEALEKESKQFMKFMVLIQKELKQPTHEFEFIVMNINKHLNGIYARCNFPAFTSKRDGVQKIEMLQQQNDKIILGHKPTPALLEKLLNEMIDKMKSFSANISKKSKLPSNLQSVVTTWDKEFQALLPKVKSFLPTDKKHIELEQIPLLRKVLLEHFRKCPEFPDTNGSIDNETLNQITSAYLIFDDVLNLTRQFPEMSTIALNFETLEESLALEIQELGEVIVEQFQTMSSIFTNQLIPHRIVQRSIRLTEFTTQLSLFFSNNSSLLNEHKGNIEQFIEQFCRDTTLTLQVINKNVQLLNPILTTDSLLVSCDALQSNVAKVISQFEKHQMTNQTASEFIKNVVPDMLSLRDKYDSLVNDPLIANQKEFITYLTEASNLITQMEKELENIKPSQLQQHCDKIYEYLNQNIPPNENELDECDVYIPTVKVYNQLTEYTSLTHKRIYITAPLIVKQQTIDQTELANLLNNAISQISSESIPTDNQFDSLLDKLIQNKKYLPSHIITMIKYLSPHLSKGSKLTQILFIKSLLCLSMSGVNYDSSSKQIQRILIEVSCLSSSLLDEVRSKVEEIDKLTDDESLSKKTIHQDDLLNLLLQIDTTTFTQLKTIPAFLMSYTNYKQVSFLLPLVQLKNKEFRKLADSYINIMNEVNLLLANNIMILLDHLINSLEIQERNLDFVFAMVQLLHDRTRSVTFDQQKLSKASDLYIKFEAANSAEISKFAMSFDKMAEAKNLIQMLTQYKPILIQWASMANATTESTQLVKSIQSPTLLLLNQLETCKSKEPTKVPLLFSLPLEEINQIIYFISQEKDKQNGADCSKYIDIVQSLEDDLSSIDRDTIEIFTKSLYDKSSKDLNSKVSNILQSIQKLNKAVGPVEIAKKVEVVHEEEEEAPKEVEVVKEKVVQIDTFKSVLEIYKSITNKKYDKVSSLVDLLRENIDRYEDLDCLRQVFEDARMYLDFSQFDELNKLKKPLLMFLNNKINWQKNVTSRASSPSSIINELIELQRQANEISGQYIDSSDREQLITKIAKVASDAQALVVQSFKFYKKRSSHLYTDLYQNSVQIWGNILSLFGNENETSIKRGFRSIRRLLADLSYIPDDLSYINSRNGGEESKSEFSKSLSTVLEKPAALFNDTALVISVFADSPLRELYDMNIEEPSKGFKDHLKAVLEASHEIAKLNNRENAGKVFDGKTKSAKKSFETFSEDIQKDPTDLKSIIQIAQGLQVALQAMCTSTKNLSDVTIRHPDFESVAKLPSRVTMPIQSHENENSNDENAFKNIFNSLQKLINENDSKNSELRSFLFESADLKNEDVADRANEYIKFVQDIISHILSASNNASNISIGENLAASASLMVINLENFNKAIKGKFLLKKDWGNDVNNALDSIVEESQKVLASCQKEIELYELGKKQKDDEERALRNKLDQAGASLRTSRTNIEQCLNELNENTNSNINLEWSKELCKLALNSSASLIKVVVFLSDHLSEILTDADQILESSQKVPDLSNNFISKVKDIMKIDTNDANSVEFETQVINAADILKTMAEILNPHFSPSKNADGQVIENTIEEIVKGAERLAETAKNMKATKIERIEARKKRQEEMEERKKSLSGIQSGKTQEQLIKRLDLESKIIQTRMAIDFQKAKIDALG